MACNCRVIGPDFCCIGAQKSGTGWLYEQLRFHPDFWMPPVKELHYFDRFWRSPRKAARGSENKSRLDRVRKESRDERDLIFADAMETLLARSEIDLEGYAQLFASKKSLLSGDITPGYSTLPDEIVERIAAHFARLKVLFIARDPVERAWSHLSMWVRHGRIPPFDVNDVDEVTRHLLQPEVLMRSYPSKIVARWRRYVSADRFRVFFFDDLTRDPAGLRDAIIGFLGGDAAKGSGPLAADHNTKAKQERLVLGEKVRAHMARFFEQELIASAAELGGPAADWPRRYGL
jgi:hypothetical protein